MKNEVVKGMERFVEDANRVEEEVIVTRILQSKELAMNTFFQCALNIGQQLLEAKKIIKHGEWTNWLKERVQFSERTAQNYMKIYKETEKNGSPLLKTQAFADLGYSQVIEILSLPGDMQEEFLTMHEAKEMSSREIKKAVAEMKAQNETLMAQLKTMEKDREDVLKAKEQQEKAVSTLRAEVKQLEHDKRTAAELKNKELEVAIEKAIKGTEKKIATAEKRSADLQAQLDKIAEAHTAELEKLKAKAEKEKEALIQKKEKELQKKTESFNDQLMKMQESLDSAEKAKHDAEAKAAINEDIVKCKVLMQNIQDTCKETAQILTRLESIDKTLSQQLRNTLNETLTALIERNKFIDAGTRKAS